MSEAKNNSQNQKPNDEAIKLYYCKSGGAGGACGWTLPRSPVPHLLDQAAVPESVWFATYDAAVEQQAAFSAPKFKNWSWAEVKAYASYCFTTQMELLNAWIKVVHEQQVIYAFYGIKVQFLRTLPAPGKTILGGLMFEGVGNKIPRAIIPHEQRSLVQELEVLHRLHQSGGLTDDEYALAKQRVIHSNGTGESVAVAVTDVPAGVHCAEASIICQEETQELTTGGVGNEKANLL